MNAVGVLEYTFSAYTDQINMQLRRSRCGSLIVLPWTNLKRLHNVETGF